MLFTFIMYRRVRIVAKVLGKVFEPKGDQVTGQQGRIHKEGLYDLYSSPNIIRSDQIKKNETGGACGTQGRKDRCIQGFGWETCGKELLGRHMRKMEDNIKMDLQELEWGNMIWIYLALVREYAVMKLEVL